MTNHQSEEKHSSLEQCPFCELTTHRNETKFQHIKHELAAHIPFSLTAVIISFAVVWLITQIGKLNTLQSAFHIFHPTHLFLSATATTAMFWRHDKKVVKAILIGIIGTLPLCGASDIFLPYLGGLMLGQKMELHICLIQHPSIIYPFVILGVVCGIFAANYLRTATFFSHTLHVIISSLASLLYIISFGLVDWIPYIGALIIIILLSVVIPCCTSDIISPLLFVHKEKTAQKTS